MDYKNDDAQTTHEDEVRIHDYWKTLVKRRRLIGVIVGAAFVTSAIISFLLPNIYAATARILPPQKENVSLTSPLLSQLPEGLGGLAGGLLSQSSTTELWAEILKSDTVSNAIISRFNLQDLYKADTIEDARKTLSKKVTVKINKADILSVKVEDKVPQRASDMANAYVEELDKFSRNLVMSTGTKKRIYWENRLIDTKLKLAQDEDELKKFQESSGAVKPDSQSELMIESMGKVKERLISKEVELRTLLSYAEPSHPTVGKLKSEVDELKKELAKLENGKRGAAHAKNGDIFIPSSKLPNLSEQYVRLQRDLKIQETLYGQMVSQYEQAKMQEAKDSPVVQVMDSAKVPTKKAKPKRGLIVSASTFFGLLISLFWAFIQERRERVGDLV